MRPTTDLQRRVAPFEVISDFTPSGDQPTAIADLVRRIRADEQDVVLLGATGTGKSATTAWMIEQLQRPTLVMAPNKTLAAQLANEFRELLPNNAVEYFVSYYDYYQPEAYIAADRHLHREGLLDQRRGRAAAALGHQLPADPPRRRGGGLGVVHLRPRHAAGVRRPDGEAARRRRRRARRAAAQVRRHAVHPQRPVLHPRHLPRARRHRRDHPGVRGAGAADRVLRRRDRRALHAQPADRRGGARRGGDVRLPGHPLRRRPGADGAGDRAASRSSSATGCTSSSSRASCSRPSGCACAPRTTSR